jgi:glycosidase
LNFQNPAVLLEMIDVLLHYIQNGAQIIRLDAIAFLWKEPGSPSIHLPQTHIVVKLLRQFLSIAAPWVHIVTETNVPHKENVSYFGNGHDEAHLVYQFALPPLTLHTLLSGDATVLTKWAANLNLPSKTTTFFNYLASHDGIGLRPAQDILDQKSLQRLLDRTLARKGKISYRSVGENQSEPYELNITLFDILAEDTNVETPSTISINRYMAAQAIMLSLQGVPGIYFHSLFGGRNYVKGVEETGMARTINREKFQFETLERWLKDPSHYSSKVFLRFCQLLHARQNQSAFNPYGIQEVLDLDSSTFALVRTSPTDGSKVLCLHNVTASEVELQAISLKIYGASGHDIINQEPINIRRIRLLPYQCRWITLNPSS